jgi:D-alanyl-D-alanine carboxypeptidase
MIERRAWFLSTRAAWVRAVVATLLVLAGLVAPQLTTVAAHAAPPAQAAADDDPLTSRLRADLEAYLQSRGVAEHFSPPD